MSSAGTVVASVAVAVFVGAHPLVAQELSRYRGFALESSVASVIEISGARDNQTKTLHERPATIQELEWRLPYGRAGAQADPVRSVLFSFCDDQLYQVAVTYDRDRTEGLTNDDLIESVSATYGIPLLRARTTRNAFPGAATADTTVVARWEDATSLLTLTRGPYGPELQLTLVSKTLNARALGAIKEALRLDVQEAPQRELDRRKKDVADARVANEKARIGNKASFRP